MTEYEGMIAETIRIQGHNGDVLGTYLARPLGAGPFPGVVVMHHMPGWDESTKEITRKLAHHGYVAIMPNLHHRVGPGTPSEQAARVRAEGGQPDVQTMGDAAASIAYLRRMPTVGEKVGIIGFCSGGRQAFLAACTLPGIDAAVDCWGGRVIAQPGELTERQPVAPIDYAADLACPLLGIFGKDDSNPDPEQVEKTEARLKELGKNYEFHSYEGAGHGFFSPDREGYRALQATDAWGKIFDFYGKYLK